MCRINFLSSSNQYIKPLSRARGGSSKKERGELEGQEKQSKSYLYEGYTDIRIIFEARTE